MIKNFEEFITEVSKRQKEREVEFTKNYFRNNKKNYKGISSFGILTPENPNNIELPFKTNKQFLDEFIKNLKMLHFRYVPITGFYKNKKEDSFIVFNITLESLKYFAGKYEQESFFFCYNKDNNTICEYWRKKNPNDKYHESKNDYIFINKTDTYWIDNNFTEYSITGNDFKFNINVSIFDDTNNTILENANNFLKQHRKNDNLELLLWECSNSQIGMYSSYLRQQIYEKTSS